MMKKSVMGIAVVLVIVAIGAIVFFSMSKNTQETTSDNANIDHNQIIEENMPELNDTQNEPVENETQEDDETKQDQYEIFNPTLTYEGAYNGPLYATSEQIGEGYDIDKYMANLDRNGVNFFIGMFPILGEQKESHLSTGEGLGYIINGVKKYPHRIVPFFNPGYGGGKIEDDKLYGEELTGLYRDTLSSSNTIAGKGFIKGFGEVETQEWSIGHDDPKVLQLINLASANNLNILFHPVASKTDDVETILKTYPNTNFLIHLFREDLDKKRSEWIRLLSEYDNLYFSIDAAHIIHTNGRDILYDYHDQYGSRAKDRFLSSVNSNYNAMLKDAVSDYKPLVEAAPKKVMWGTEAGPTYAFEPEVYDIMIKISRDFIADVSDDVAVQEDIGYKNALRVFGEGVVLNNNVNVVDTSSWELCTDSQVSTCDDECGIKGDSDDTSIPIEQEVCLTQCVFDQKCIDPVIED